MEIKLEYFLVTELHYKTETIEDESLTKDGEFIEHDTKFTLGIHESLNQAFIEIESDINTSFKIEERTVPFRQLQITIRYFYDLKDANNEDEVSKVMTSDRFTEDIQSKMTEVVRNITNIDFQPPIILRNAVITF